MSQVIGRVRLSKGRVGYFDELTRIHLTISRPEAPVYAGMNTANLKRAVRGGVLRLVAGSLELEQTKVVKDIHTTEATKAAIEKVEEVVVPVAPAKEEAKAEAKAEVKEEAKAEEVKAEEVEADEKAKEVSEEAKTEEAEEKAEAKTTRKRKTAASKETANKE